ncbi:MAG TPA: 4Fe-4S binding protein [Rhodocyclaceae bacterium]|nr:4Fe-4S binding protein [Rhodocyclaceae bacterium]
MGAADHAFLAVSEAHAAVVAALRAAMKLPAPAPVQAVDYVSSGRTLIIGPADIALDWAERLKDRLEVSVLATEVRGNEELPPRGDYAVAAGRDIKLQGWLGSFMVEWQQAATPETGLIGTPDFSTTAARKERYDLIFDLSREPLIRLPHPPQGYFSAGRDPLEQFDAILKLTSFVGEFEKPRYFDYKADQCAHARNRIEGCSNCIDLCSTGAITPKGDGVYVEPHLCMGCGACASSCPSGAMRYNYPSVPELGLRLKTMLAAYREAGGAAPVVVFHDRKGEDWLLRRAHRQGLPQNLIPLGVHDIASIGPDLLLAALCYGAAHVGVLQTDEMPAAYTDNLRRQIALVHSLLEGFGFAGEHCSLLAHVDAPAAALPETLAQPMALPPASFNLFAEKRRTLQFCIEHLQAHALQAVEQIALPAGSPFGTLNIAADRCTLCMACVGACPAKALQDNPESPQLRFIESNCVQCGICADTCPESALALEPRLLLTPQAKQARVLNEAQPFHCVRCAKPFGTRAMVDSMLQRLSGHSLFADEAALRRLQMCGDCRVIDMMENRKEMTVEDLPR